MNARDFYRVMKEEGLVESAAVRYFLYLAAETKKAMANMQPYLDWSIAKGCTAVYDGIEGLARRKDDYIWMAIDTARAEKYLGIRIEEDGDAGIVALYEKKQSDHSIEMHEAEIQVSFYYFMKEYRGEKNVKQGYTHRTAHA